MQNYKVSYIIIYVDITDITIFYHPSWQVNNWNPPVSAPHGAAALCLAVEDGFNHGWVNQYLIQVMG